MNVIENYKEKIMSPGEAVKLVKSGDTVYVSIISSMTYMLMEELWKRRSELSDVNIAMSNQLRLLELNSVTDGNPFTIMSYFMGPGERVSAKNGLPVRYTSFHLSQVEIWVKKIARPNICFLECSLPDEDGYVTMGPGGGCTGIYAADIAEKIVLHINPKSPYLCGEGNKVHLSQADAIVIAEDEYTVIPKTTEFDEEIALMSAHILKEIPDGATIQLGIGGLGAAIGHGLKERNDLGIFTEMFNNPMVDLIKNGNVTNKHKGFMDGISVYSFAAGDAEMYEFMNRNESLYGMPFGFVNDARNIAKNKRMISINAAMSINLFGEVAADCMAFKQQSAVGGQLDYVRGAQWSEGGKSIIAMNSSMVKNGKRMSKIVLDFPMGTPTTTPRSDIQYVATEFGCINIKELHNDDRVRALISLAHPDFRDELTQQAKDNKLI